MAIVAALVMVGTMSACAQKSAAPAASGASGTSAASSTAPSARSSSAPIAGTPTSQPAQLPKATCGRIGTRGAMTGYREFDAGALTCFRKAAAACSDASLLVTESGVDSGSSSLIAVHRVDSGCAVDVAVQSYMAPRPPSAISHLDCGRIQVDGSGETVDCGKAGKYSIPVHAG